MYTNWDQLSIKEIVEVMYKLASQKDKDDPRGSIAEFFFSEKYSDDRYELYNFIIENIGQLNCFGFASLFNSILSLKINEEKFILAVLNKLDEFYNCDEKRIIHILYSLAHIQIKNIDKLPSVRNFFEIVVVRYLSYYKTESLTGFLYTAVMLCYDNKSREISAIIGEIKRRDDFYEVLYERELCNILWLFCILDIHNDMIRKLFQSIDSIFGTNRTVSSETLSQLVISWYYYYNDHIQNDFPNINNFIRRNERTIRNREIKSSFLHEGIHNHLVNIFNEIFDEKESVILEKEKYLYGFFVDDYFRISRKKICYRSERSITF